MQKLTDGNIHGQIIRFMFPVLIGNTLQRLYTLVDTIMVGRLIGTQSLAAVGAAGTIAMLAIVICNGFTSGFSIVISQAYGAGDTRRVRSLLAATYVLSGILGILLTAAGVLFIKPMLAWTNVPEDIYPLASAYLHVMMVGLVSSLIYNLAANILRALGDSIIPLVFLMVSVLCNVFLDYFYIVVLKRGVAGAAVATIISQFVSGIGCLVFCRFKRPLLFVQKEDFHFSKDCIRQLLFQGTAMSLMVSVVSLGSVILQSGINKLGSSLLAGYTAGRKLIEFFMMPCAALSMTAVSFASQNYGARRFDRIKQGTRIMIVMGIIWSTVLIAFVYMFGRYLIMLITGSGVSDTIISAGVLYMRINVPVFYALTVLLVVRSTLQGIDSKRIPVATSCVELAVKILAIILFVPKLGFLGVCITEPIIWILGALWVCPVYYAAVKNR